MSDPHRADSSGSEARFATTHWTTVLAAGEGSSADSREALARLCERYWYPLYAYVRRRGNDPADAQDLTQAFFARLFERELLKRIAPEGGRFRSFLLTALKHFLTDEWKRGRARKRGGGRTTLSIDERDAEERYRVEPVDTLNPERLFERRWALTLLESALARLEEEYRSSGKVETFARLRSVLLADSDAPAYSEIGAQLGISEGAVKVAAHRMRSSFRRLLRAEIADTVNRPEEVDEELRHLFVVLAR